MPQTLFIDTASLPRHPMPGGGEMTEILNDARAGAKNVVGTLRWLTPGATYETPASQGHQLVYLMEGRGSLTLEGATHAVHQGAGVYLGPSERATIRADAGVPLELFHLEVPQIPR